MPYMATARAVVAGVLVCVLAVDLLSEPAPVQDDVTVWVILLVVVSLLVIPDMVHQWKHRNDKEDD